MTRCLVVAAFLGAVVTQPAYAQFGSLPKAPTGGGGLSAGEIDKFVGAAKVANAKMTETEAALFPLVVSKEEADEYDRNMKAAVALPNVQERDAKVEELKAAAAARVKAIKADDPAVIARMQKASPDQKTKIKDAIVNFLGAAAADVGLAIQGKKLATQKPDLSAAAKAPELTQAVKDVVEQATAGVKVADNLKRLATTAKIDIPADSFAKVLDTGFP